MPASAALRGMDPALDEVAQSLGLSRRAIFWRSTVPQLRPVIANGALLVASHMLVEFGAFAFLRVQTFTTAIYEEFDLEFNSATGVSLAAVLLALCLLLLALEARMKGSLRRYARVGSGTRRAPPQIRLGVWQLPAAAALLTMVATGVGVPVVTLLYWVTSGRSQAAVGEMATATATTIWLGALGQSGYLALVRVYPLRVPVALFEPRRFGDAGGAAFATPAAAFDGGYQASRRIIENLFS